MNITTQTNLIIVGAGASGLLASILASKNGKSVLLLEQNTKVGKKILVSGNGKCNIGNNNIAPYQYHSSNPPFIEEVLAGYDAQIIKNLFADMGLLLIEGKEGKLFPMSMQASSVVEILLYEAQRLGVELICNCTVESISKKQELFILQTTQGQKRATELLLASGSPAVPKLGGSSSGLEMAQSLGHTLIPTYPSLVQLCSDEPWVKEAMGVKCEALVKLYANNEYITQKQGDILFTNYGISGLAILDISRAVSIELASYSYCSLSIDLLPQLSKEQLIALLLAHHSDATRPIKLWLQGILHKKLIPIILLQSKTKAKIVQELNRKEIGKIVYAIKNLKLSISQTKGFENAEVAIGGVNTSEVNAQIMESKIVKNLYFAGEILDVDGNRGGFNFHFAWVCALRMNLK